MTGTVSAIFIGYPLSTELKVRLSTLPQSYRSIYVGDSEMHLKEIEWDGRTYLGKKLKSPSLWETLDLAKANVYSMLDLILPGEDHHQTPLALIPVLA